jgi:hypothetical protein
MTSEVACLREQYELEYQAGKRALEDLATVASHAFINQRMGGMWDQLRNIERAVGRDEARRIIFGERTSGAETPA